MDITVTFHNGRWVTDPSPAIVAVGTRVRWVFRTPDFRNRQLLWQVSFESRLPFGVEHSFLKARTLPADHPRRGDYDRETLSELELPQDAPITHSGETETQPANRPGQFKYDLHLADAATGEAIGDDDPWLVVVRDIKPYHPFSLHRIACRLLLKL